MSDLQEELAKLAGVAPSLKEEATLRQYFIGALDQFVRDANLFSVDAGPLFRLDERIIRGKPDSRLGALTFEVKLPKPRGEGLPAAVKQASGYIDEFALEFVKVRGVAYDGVSIVLLDEQKNIVFKGDAPEGASLLAAWLTLLAPEAKTPDDMVFRFGSASHLSRNTIKVLHALYERFSASIPFIQEVYTIWEAVYGCAANINRESVQALRQSARQLGIKIKGKSDAEKFVFALETYLSILLKLLVARVAVEKKLVTQESVFALIGDPPGREHIRYTELSSLIPHLANVFEEDPFDWFIDAAREDRTAKEAVSEVLRCVAETIDNVRLVEMGQDFLRIFYQHFFDTASRRALGEFYTNDELVKETLDAVGYDGDPEKRLMDFCCGSGNFLVEVLNRLKKKGKHRKPALLLSDIQKTVFGVDIHPLAVAMARVNFIIAVAPLLEPGTELQVPIFWGDSLAKLVKKGKSRRLSTFGEPVNISIPGMRPFDLPDPEKFSWEKLFSFAKDHIGTLRGRVEFSRVWKRFEQEFPREEVLPFENVLERFITELVNRHNARRDTRWLPMLRNILFLERQKGKLHYIVGNPPWVRIHNIDEELRKRINDDYAYCADAGWKRGCDLAGIGRGFAKQTDLCVPFVERAFELLNEGGYFSFVITSKILQELYANALRRDLLTQRTLLRLSDYSLYPLPLFEGAINYPLVISVRNQKPTADSVCHVQITNSQKQKLTFDVAPKELSLLPDDPESPWLMAPPEVVSVFRKMQCDGRMLGEEDATRPRMGVKTGANEIYVVGGLEGTDALNEVMITIEGGRALRIEKSLLRPMVRGRDIKAWSYSVRQAIIWTHDDRTGHVLDSLPKRGKAYFSEPDTTKKLGSRDDFKDGMPIWTIFRVSKEKLGLKVAWKKYGTEMQSTMLEQEHPLELTGGTLLIPLQTVYFIPVESRDEGLLLAGVFNSVPFKTLMMSFAVRARGAYFHYTAWTVGLGLTPVSAKQVAESWKSYSGKPASPEVLKEIVRLSKLLHGNLAPAQRNKYQVQLEERVGDAFHLTQAELRTLTKYYEYMRPPREETGLLEEADEEDSE